MTTQITVATLETAQHAVVVTTTFGDPVKINPGEKQVFDVYPGHTILSIDEGDQIAAKEGDDPSVQLTDQQKADVDTLLPLYGDMNVGVGADEGHYKIVDNSGNVFAEGTVDVLVQAAQERDAKALELANSSAKEGDDLAGAKTSGKTVADGTEAKEETGVEALPENLTEEQKAQALSVLNNFPNTKLELDGDVFVIKNDQGEEVARGTHDELLALAEEKGTDALKEPADTRTEQEKNDDRIIALTEAYGADSFDLDPKDASIIILNKTDNSGKKPKVIEVSRGTIEELEANAPQKDAA